MYGPFFFGEQTETGNLYHNVLQLQEDSILETVVFQQDGDLPHFALIVREYLQVYKVKIKQAVCNITPAMLNKVFEVQGVAGKPVWKCKVVISNETEKKLSWISCYRIIWFTISIFV